MEILSGFLLVGFLIVLVGIFLIYKNLHSNPYDITEMNEDVRYANRAHGDKICGICGKSGVDVLCSKCGTLICERCYDPETDTCIECGRKKINKTLSEKQLLYIMGGAMLTFIGVFISSFAFIPLTNARIVAFPLMFENVNSISAILISLMFFCMFAVASIFPFYISLRKNYGNIWDEGYYKIYETRGYTGNITEKVEYVITTEISEKLKDTIYIEDNLDEIVLRSEKDPSFKKNYTLPESYIIDSLESDYENGFLLLKIKLIKE